MEKGKTSHLLIKELIDKSGKHTAVNYEGKDRRKKFDEDFGSEITKIKFSILPDSNENAESCENTAKGMVNRLQAFIKNGHSTEGLDFKYDEVKGV